MEKEPVDYDLVDKLGALLCATALAKRDPLAQLAALGPAQPTAAALEDYVVELRGRILQGIIDAGTSRVKLAEQLGVERSRVQAMLKQGHAARVRREEAQARSEHGAEGGPPALHAPDGVPADVRGVRPARRPR